MAARVVFTCLALTVFWVQPACGAGAQWDNAVEADSPLHWYRFDETSGGLCVDHGRVSLSGTYSGVVLGEDGLLGPATAVEFVGSSFVDFGAAPPIASDWTAEYIVMKKGDVSQALHDDGVSSLRIQGWSMQEAGFTLYGVADYRFVEQPGQDASVPRNEWRHVVFRRNSAGMQLFINGELAGTHTTSIDMPQANLGARRNSPGDAFYGLLDEAVVYDRALTDEQIRIHAEGCMGTSSVLLPEEFEPYADTEDLLVYWSSTGQLTLETADTHQGSRGAMKAVLPAFGIATKDVGEVFDYSLHDGEDLVVAIKGVEGDVAGDVTLLALDVDGDIVESFTLPHATTTTEWTTIGVPVDAGAKAGWSRLARIQITVSTAATVLIDDIVFGVRQQGAAGDLNGDGAVDLADLVVFADQWLDPGCFGPGCADFDRADGVDMRDLALLAANWRSVSHAVEISEFMAMNSYVPFLSSTDIHTTVGGIAEHADWIEMHNKDAENGVSLAGWYLTDDRENLTKWRLPSVFIPADGYLVVYASGKTADEYPDNFPFVDDTGNLHTNFELSGTGEYLALVWSDGATIISEYAPGFPPQRGLVSYGVGSNGLTGYLKDPTPAAPNGACWAGAVADTTFSVDRGFYETGQSLNVQIRCEAGGAVIRYTLDGSTPTLSNGSTYTAPVAVTSTTCLRAAAFKDDWLSTNVDTQTYIFLDDVIRQSPNGETPVGWPAGLVNGQVLEYGMDPDIVDSGEYGPLMIDAMKAIPSISLVTDLENLVDPATGIYVNAGREGVLWERPTSVELIYAGGGAGFQIDAGLRIRGGYSRSGTNPKHSFRLLFRGAYGRGKLEFPLFGDEKGSTFDNLDLRTAQNYAWSNWGNDASRNTFLRDVYSRDLQREMKQPYTASRYYHLYINGQYWGLYQSQERSEASYAESYFGDDKLKYDVVKADGYRTGYTDGMLGKWNELWSICEAGFDTDQAWYAVQGRNAAGEDDPNLEVHVDVTNLVDYMIGIFFTGNRDAPVTLSGTSANNFFAIRNRDPRSRQGWQFFAYDSEHSMLSVGDNRTTWVSAGSAIEHFNPQWLHQKLSVHPEYRLLFADRVQRHFFNDGVLTAENARALCLRRAAEIDLAIIGESARWGDHRSADAPYTRAHWWAEVKDYLIDTFLSVRTDTVLNQLKTAQLYPQVAAPQFRIGGNLQHGGYVPGGAVLSMTVPASSLYTDVLLVPEQAPVRVHVPLDDALGLSWTQNTFVPDATWTDGSTTTGVGYENGSGYQNWIATDVAAEMVGKSTSAYCRIQFDYDGATIFEELLLRVRYDDGFIAYLNGHPVYRTANITNDTPPTATATNHEAGASYDEFDISTHIDKLAAGANVLAIHGINFSNTSSDFIVQPMLVGRVLDLGGGADPVLYTTDGADPRRPGGSPSSGALEYSGPISLSQSTRFKARTFTDGQWSALNEAVFAVGPVKESLRITEIMYHPIDSDAEFVELLNAGEEPINLNQVCFDGGITFMFGPIDVPAGQFVVLVGSEQVFRQTHPDFSGLLVGDFAGKLDNAGDKIRLVDALGNVIHEFTYRDGWYPVTDGDGFSLTVRDPYEADLSVWDSKAGWRPSAARGGSPGYDDSGVLPAPGSVVINEVLAHSHADAPDWIELYNATGEPINIGGWFFSDSQSDPQKYEVADGTVIGAGEHLVFYEDVHFGATAAGPGTRHASFGLSEGGETVHLQSAAGGVLTGYVASQDFGASATGVSFGRFEKETLSGGFDFVPMEVSTPGQANSVPLVGPVIVTEIMYRPGSTNEGGEFIELRNITEQPVVLQGLVSSQLGEDPGYLVWETVAWRFTNGIEYTFPPNTMILAGGCLIVAEDPAAFRAWYGEVGSPVLGPFEDDTKLNNGGERVTLSRPGDQEWQKQRYYTQVDSVAYDDSDPWPAEADGTGASLQHKYPADVTPGQLYGNDPDNWTARQPAPGE